MTNDERRRGKRKTGLAAKNETAIQKCIDYEGIQYVISHNNKQTFYYLYKDVDGKLLEIGKAKNPVDFDKIIWGT